MSDSLPPVAIRVARPHATEDELLENELETLTRTSITLIGAQPRPPGLMLRFELLLSSGQVIVRGEGRVVGYKPDAYYGMGGLTLRFTRLDSRSKALVDKAVAMRERRRPFATTGPMETLSLAPPIALEDVLEDSGPPDSGNNETEAPSSSAAASAASSSAAASADVRSGAPQRDVEPSSEPPPPPSRSEAPAPHATPLGRGTLGDTITRTAPRDRDALLERLRERSKALDGDTIRKILERRR